MATTGGPATFRRAVVLMTITSFLVPAAGVITAPLLARGLSVDGRGELAAALAPAGLALAAATLGLPDALTYFLAKRPEATRRLVAGSSLVTVVLGVVCVAVTWLALPFLRGGDLGLGRLILIATVLTIPALVVNVLRGAATGLQMWRAVAVERLINVVSRVVALAALFAADRLTVLSAILVSVVTPVLAGVAYLPVLTRTGASGPSTGSLDGAADREVGPRTAEVLHYGGRVWFGSVASMMLSRAAILLMAPLAGVEALGLYSVAVTISDLPLVVALAIQGALFGTNARTADAEQVAATSRMTILAGLVGCGALALSLPFWITRLFGEEFGDALVPTLILMVSAIMCMPGLMGATGLAAWGRPGLRSVGLGVTLVANVTFFVLLVPPLGVYGACITSVLSNVVMTGFMLGACRRVLGLSPLDFLLVRRSDVDRAVAEGRALLRRLPVGSRS